MELTDGELLSRFLASGEQSAFEIVVRRHSALVFGVCTRVLGTTHDAEDAAQAVFLTLAHKASSLRQYGSIAGWLYRVAFNVAQRTREAGQRRNNREREAGARMESAGDASQSENAEWQELKPLLDTELHALPEKYRLPLILHYVEGRTQEEIATLLGCSYGAISGRLNHARNVLRERLARRGLAFSPAILFLLIPKFSPVALPEGIVTASAKAAVLIAAGNAAAPGLVSTQAAALTQGALRMMYVSKLKVAAAVIVGVVALTGAGVVTFHAAAADTAQTAPRPMLQTPAPAAQVAAAPTAPAGDKAAEKTAEVTPKPPTAAEIQGWIGELGNDDLAIRSAAFSNLRNSGEAAREALTKAATAKSRAGEAATTLLAEIKTHAILQKVTDKSKVIKTLEAKVSISALTMGNMVNGGGSMKAVPAAKKLNMNMTITMGAMQIPMLMVCDGTTYWQEMTMPAGPNGVKMVTKFPSSFMDDASNSNATSPLAADKYESQADFTEMKTDTFNGKEVYVLTGHIRPDTVETAVKKATDLGGDMAGSMAKAMMEQIDVTHLYVGKEDSYVYKFEALNKEGKPVQSMEITDIKADEAIDDSVFVYCPPAGATVVDGMEQLKKLKSGTSAPAESATPQAPPKAKDNF